MVVDELPPDERVAGRGGKGGEAPDTSDRIGLMLSKPTPEQKQRLEIDNGLLVEDMLRVSLAAPASCGRVILSINNQDVKTVEQLTSCSTR